VHRRHRGRRHPGGNRRRHRRRHRDGNRRHRRRDDHRDRRDDHPDRRDDHPDRRDDHRDHPQAGSASCRGSGAGACCPETAADHRDRPHRAAHRAGADRRAAGHPGRGHPAPGRLPDRSRAGPDAAPPIAAARRNRRRRGCCRRAGSAGRAWAPGCAAGPQPNRHRPPHRPGGPQQAGRRDADQAGNPAGWDAEPTAAPAPARTPRAAGAPAERDAGRGGHHRYARPRRRRDRPCAASPVWQALRARWAPPLRQAPRRPVRRQGPAPARSAPGWVRTAGPSGLPVAVGRGRRRRRRAEAHWDAEGRRTDRERGRRPGADVRRGEDVRRRPSRRPTSTRADGARRGLRPWTMGTSRTRRDPEACSGPACY